METSSKTIGIVVAIITVVGAIIGVGFHLMSGNDSSHHSSQTSNANGSCIAQGSGATANCAPKDPATADPGTVAACKIHPEPSLFADPPITKYRLATSSEAEANGVINARTEPCTLSESHARGALKPGSPVSILCQAKAEKVYRTSAIWDYLSDHTWVADYFVAGTKTGVFTPGIPHCTS